MSDETPDKSTTPGSTPSEGSHASGVPRLDKHQSAKPVQRKSSVGATLKNLAAESGFTSPAGASQAPEAAIAAAAEAQDEAEAADAAEPKTESPAKRSHTPVVKAGANKPKVGGVKPVERPVTAGEYARTTKGTAAGTAVIPVVTDETPAPSPAQAATASAGRRASLKLIRIDPWSVTKVVFALTVAMMIVAVVAVTILWIVLSFAGVWDQINSSVTTVLSDNSSTFDITQYIGFTRIVGLTLVISAINVVISTAVATIGAYLYNLAAQLLGGVDVTLAEED